MKTASPYSTLTQASAKMGHQLWASPITGYRRKGTRLSELRSLTEAGITAYAILEPLKSCLAEASAGEAAEMLRRRDFDVAGVKESPGEYVIGWVTADELRDGSVRDHMRLLIANDLISDATPLSAVLSILKRQHSTFILIGPEVGGIVTRADLNKPPVRIYLLSLVSLLEMHLSFWINEEYPGDSWKKQLDDKRISDAEKLQKQRRRRNQEQTLLECLQFCDKRDLVVPRNDLRIKLGMGGKTAALRSLKRAELLRNGLSHSQQDLAHGTSWKDLISLVEWIEVVVGHSDGEVEKKAAKNAEAYADGLLTSA